MNLYRYNLLVNANIRRNKNSTSTFVMMLISVIALVLITSFSWTLSITMDNFRNQDPARRLSIDSPFESQGLNCLNSNIINKISQLEHVESVDISNGMQYQFFDIKGISDGNKDCSRILPVPVEQASIETWALYKTQKMEVIAGEKLDESPVFSCIVPSTFCPCNDYNAEKNSDKLQNGLDYLGKTLTVNPYKNTYEMLYYKEVKGIGYLTDWYYLPGVDYQLRVVGVYLTSYDGNGDPNKVYVSNETGKKIEQMAVDATKNKEFIEEYQKNKEKPELHSYTVLVDHAQNVNIVRTELENLKINVSSLTEKIVPPDVGLFASVFTAAGNFFTIAILILTIINLFLSTSNRLMDRKGEIGLLKAVGYKNRQIFLSMYLEQLQLGLRAFGIGGAVSAAAVLVINLVNANGPFVNRIYVVSWIDFTVLAAYALALVVLIPLICQLIMARSLMKITPREAMAQR